MGDRTGGAQGPDTASPGNPARIERRLADSEYELDRRKFVRLVVRTCPARDPAGQSLPLTQGDQLGQSPLANMGGVRRRSQVIPSPCPLAVGRRNDDYRRPVGKRLTQRPQQPVRSRNMLDDIRADQYRTTQLLGGDGQRFVDLRVIAPPQEFRVPLDPPDRSSTRDPRRSPVSCRRCPRAFPRCPNPRRRASARGARQRSLALGGRHLAAR